MSDSRLCGEARYGEPDGPFCDLRKGHGGPHRVVLRW